MKKLSLILAFLCLLSFSISAQSLLTDDWNTNTISANWTQGDLINGTAGTGVTVVAQNQRLEITPANGFWKGLYTASTYNLTTASVRVQVPIAGSQTNGQDVYFAIALDSSNWAIIIINNGVVTLRKNEAGSSSLLAQANYSYNDQQYFRFKTTASSIQAQTSANGTAWTNLGSAFSVSWSLTAARVTLEGGASASSIATTIFDNFSIYSGAEAEASPGPTQYKAPSASFTLTTPSQASATYAWSQTAGPASSTITNATTNTASITLPSNRGTYTFQIVTTLGTSTATQTVNVIVPLSPVAVTGGPYSALDHEAIIFDGSGSTYYQSEISTYGQQGAMPQSDGSPSVIWDFGDGLGEASKMYLIKGAHMYASPGTYTVTLTVKSQDGSSNSTTTTATVTAISTGGTTYTLTDQGSAGANATLLQTRIDSAVGGDVIVLPAGVSYQGPITLPNHTGSYVTIRSSALSSLTAGQRVSMSSVSNMPIILSGTGGGGVDAIHTTDPSATGSHHWRLQGIYVAQANTTIRSDTVWLGENYGGAQDTTTKLPHHFQIDRCVISGRTVGGATTQSIVDRTLRADADYVSVFDSYLENATNNADSNAYRVINGVQGHAVWNNYLEGAGENVLTGGAETDLYTASAYSSATTTSATLTTVSGYLSVGSRLSFPIGQIWRSTTVRSIAGNNVTYDALPTVPNSGGTCAYGLIPRDLEFRRNYLNKPDNWNPSNGAYDSASRGNIKNLFELKNADRVVFDSNYNRHMWIAAQRNALVFTVVNQGSSNAGRFNRVRNVQVSNNKFIDIASAFSVYSEQNYDTDTSGDILLYNNLFKQTNANGGDWGMLFGGIVGSKHYRVFLNHNLFWTNAGANQFFMNSSALGAGQNSEGDWLVNTAIRDGTINASSGNGNTAVVERFLNATLQRDALANISSYAAFTNSATFPAQATFDAYYTSPSANDFSLTTAGNTAIGTAAMDGTSIGPNWTTLNNATISYLTGIWAVSGSLTPLAPTSLTATWNSSTQITLTWTDPNSGTTQETGYEVYQCTGANHTGCTLVTTTAADSVTFPVTSLTPATTYYFDVRAVNGTGNSAYATVVDTTTLIKCWKLTCPR